MLKRNSYKIKTVEESMAKASPEEKKAYAVKQLRENLKDVLRPEDDDYNLTKWLKARTFDIKKAEKMFRDSMVFRKRIGADTILQDYTIPEVIKKYMPGGLVGHDKDGSPLKIELYGNIDMKGIMYSCRKVDLEKSKVYMCEQIVQDWRDQSKKLGKRVDGLTVIFDMADVGAMTHLWRPGITMYLHLVKILEDNYPEMMKNMFVINAPTIFPILYKMSRPLVTEEMRAKIHVLGTDYLPTLLKYMDKEELPVAYGGYQVGPDNDVKCTHKVCQGGQVPESMFLKDINTTDNMEHANISRGDKLKLEYKVEKENSILRWDFKTDGFDIGFGVQYKKDNNEYEVVKPVERVDSHIVPEDGSINCDKTGTYVLVFDNSFSWARGKKLYYTVEIIAALEDNLHSELDEIAAVGDWDTLAKDLGEKK